MHSHHIIVKKAREHNLQNVDLELNSNELIVFTGLSGSGKSSMAFDTLYVEGQRRYIQSLSPSARRILEQVKKPNVDEVLGLSPTICIAQKSISKNPRSTVGTVTEIHDYLRLLFARVGIAYCPISGERVTPQSKESIIKVILEEEEAQLLILAPLVQGKKGAFKEELSGFMQRGYLKARIDGHMLSLDEEFTLDKNKTHDIDLVIDRVKIDKRDRARIIEAITAALELSRGMLITLNETTQQENFYSTFGFSKKSKQFYPPLEPHDFSFNSPLGMCPTCYGLGIQPGSEDKPCTTCKGKRIRAYPAAAQFCGKTITQITAMTIEEAYLFLKEARLDAQQQAIAEEVIRELLERLSFLLDVGLSYLTLDRPAPTLSGGEAQRVHLASHVGSGLVGITYILDEPSIGLHPRDNLKLIKTLIRLKELGNTVIVVEHDEETILAADRIVDFGPKAGRHGGHILVNGTLETLINSPQSFTGAYISHRRSIEIPKRREIDKKRQIVLSGAKLHNLKNVTLALPLGCMIAVTGVSGSGKSSLISQTLAPALINALHKEKHECGPFTKLEGADLIDKMITIDQSPIGRTPRSNPATYMKIFDEIRALFSELPAARAKGFSSGRFSFNVKEGSCSKCSGLGMTKIDMDFMEDTWLTCDLCEGKRFDAQTLSILYKGKSIHDILQMTVEEALGFFENLPTLKRKLELICQVGLAYLTLGQSSTTLSGGEAQRIKLAKELIRPDTKNTFYILDEPTTGLHFHDIHTLLRICHTLVDRGNTLLIIEHNMDVVKVCDHVIDLGPEAGARGGEILAQGTPEEISQLSSPTGEALVTVLNKQPLSSFKKHEVSSPKKEIIFVENAHENNLKYVTVSLPKNKLICITGPSGSGKTSFAFDTLYAEGNRRYTETLSAYARQFVHISHRPKCSRMEGLQASIAIEPRNQSSNPRSTLGTLTEIYDYLRLLYLHMGVAYCPESGEKIQSINNEFVLKQLLSYPKEERITILAPMKLRKQESFGELVEHLRAQGFLRIELNGTLYDLDNIIPFNERNKNNLSVLIDRIKLSEKEKNRLTEAIETTLKLSKDQILVQRESGYTELFNLAFAVIKTGKSYPTLIPQSFSFNHVEGMCPTCEGKGGPCPECKGARLNALARNVEVAGKTLFTICEYPLTELHTFFKTLEFPPLLQEVQEQIEARLGFLLEVGLGYLSLSRTIGSLSNGEAQRVRLARQLGSNLRGVLYILDEPTIGLHPRDIEGFNTICKKLKALGNTLILVEHDPMTLAIADHLVAFGPKAGKEGGSITFEGSLEKYTLPSLSFSHIASPPQEMFTIREANLHNLKNITVDLPLSRLTTLTGVSGSGKSTLMHEVIYPYVKTLIQKKEGPFAEVIAIDQYPIHLTPRSDVSSYTDLLIHLRTFYASLPLARARGLLPQHFSHNHRRGMCTHCQGLGYVTIDMVFFPAINQPCERCGGLRLNPVSLDITYQGLNLGQLLQRSVAEVASLFHFLPKAKRILDTLLSCGLGYLPLSQQILTLSTGEAQRIKLCAELSKAKASHTLYLFDEPTTGLALSDIDILLRLLYRLVEKGNTVLVIEHTMEFIQCSDYIIELGPVAGDNGGYLIAEGNAESLKHNPSSVTGKYLK
jgi:excinuclease ABC subunit A